MLYQQIARNKRLTFLLITVEIILIVSLAYFMGYALGDPQYGIYMAFLGFLISGLMTFIIYYNSDKLILAVSGAKLADEKDYKQLNNIVEEISISAGLPKPRVYIIRDDNAPNAFATGRNPKHAAVAVTTALLNSLNREELQAVIAHEIGHIQNFDILFASLMGVMVGMVAMMADFFWRIAFFSRGRRGGKSSGQAQLVMIAVALILAILAPIAAKIIQMAMSRQREFLADATSAKLTSNPQGLINALVKISKNPGKLQSTNRAIQHLYIVNPIQALAANKNKSEKTNLFSTHPPLSIRVKRLQELVN